MAKSKQQKKEDVAAMVKHLQSMQSAVFATAQKVRVKEERALRAELKKLEASFVVVKKTLLKRALEELALAADVAERLTGTVMLIVGRKDAVAPLKALTKFAKGRESFSLEGGFLMEQGAARALSKDDVIALSQIASREELLARAAGSIRAPLSGMVNVLAGNLRGLVQVLSAIQKAKT